MKRIRTIAFLLLLAALLSACSLTTYRMDEILPAPIDAATLLPIIESVSVVRPADGATALVAGTAVETFMLSFDGLVCTRKAAAEYPLLYTVHFQLADGEQPVLQIKTVESTGEIFFGFGEYDYYLVNTKWDVYAIESLLSGAQDGEK